MKWIVVFLTSVFLSGCNGQSTEINEEHLENETETIFKHFKVIEDSWVRRSNSINYGDSSELYINREGKDASTDGWFADTLLKFDISNLDKSENIETIHLVYQTKYVNPTYTPLTVDIYEISSDWDETTVSGETKLNRGVHLGTLSADETATGISILDITEYIKESDLNIVSFFITAENSLDKAAAKIQSQYVNHGKQIEPHLSVALKKDVNKKAPKILERFLSNDYTQDYYLHDWAYAGISNNISTEKLKSMPVFKVEDYNASPTLGVDNVSFVQDAINAAEEAGGGIVEFSEGVYDFNIVDIESSRPLVIRSSNVIIRGQGDKTILRQYHSVSTPFYTGTNTPHFISFVGEIPPSSVYNPLLKDSKAGDRKITVNNRSDLKPGDTVSIQNFTKNGEDPNAALEVIQPLTPYSAWSNFNRYSSFLYKATIEKVEESEEGTVLTLYERLPFAFKTEYHADARLSPSTIQQVGVEDLTLSMVMPEGYAYSHVSPEPLHYQNAAIRFSRVSDSWVSNVTIENFTQNITLSQSSYNEINDVTMTSVGGGGHHGIGIYGASTSNLVKNITFDAWLVHGVSFNGHSNGNVISNIESTKLKTDVYIDFHGAGLPSFNLVENSKNILVQSSGSNQNMPHAGTRNTFWNINSSGGEFFSASSAWDSSNDYFDTNGFDHFMVHPKSQLIGVKSRYAGASINKSKEGHPSEWYYLERFNEGSVLPISLYEYQKELIE